MIFDKIIVMKDAIFFDLDGTLWDAIEEIKDSWNKAMEDNNLPYRFDYPLTKSFMGLTPEETCPLAFKDRPLKEGMELFKLCLKYEIEYLSMHPGKLYPNEKEVLENLSNKYDLYIVSNADKGYIENYLKIEGINHLFKGHLCAGDTLKDKHENIRILMEKENIKNCIYVGDTLKDMKESLKANVKFIHAAYGFGVIENYKYKINNLNELEEMIYKIKNNL